MKKASFLLIFTIERMTLYCQRYTWVRSNQVWAQSRLDQIPLGGRMEGLSLTREHY